MLLAENVVSAYNSMQTSGVSWAVWAKNHRAEDTLLKAGMKYAHELGYIDGIE